MTGSLEVAAPDGVPEVTRTSDLAALVLSHLELADGDVLAVTSKVVAKAEGRVVTGDREELITAETVRLVAHRGGTRIVRTRHGLVMAAAGVDASNLPRGSIAPLPVDPDASARALRHALRERCGANVAVIVTDTIGRAWRAGQTDLAIGAAGLTVLESYAGREDAYGNPLAVTEPAVADELASAAELAAGKLTGRPFARLRGRPDLVLPPGDDGPGAVAMVRPEGADLFGFGAREAVVRALAGRAEDRAVFGSPADPAELAQALATVTGRPATVLPGGLVAEGDPAVVAALAFAHGWTWVTGVGGRLELRPGDPGDDEQTPPGPTVR